MWNLYKCLVRHHLIFYYIGPFDYTNLASLTYHYHVFLHSTGPCKFITSPLRATANWNFIAWISLCPLNNVLWLLFGLQTGQSCPSCPSYRGCRICLTIVHGCSFSMHFFRKQNMENPFLLVFRSFSRKYFSAVMIFSSWANTKASLAFQKVAIFVYNFFLLFDRLP